MISFEQIVFAASVVSAFGVIGGLLWRAWKLVDSVNKNLEFADFCRLWTLRIAVVSEEFPLDERIDAGRKYIAHGGNGYVKHYVEALEELQNADAHDDAGKTL